MYRLKLLLGRALGFIVYYLYDVINLGGWPRFITYIRFEVIVGLIDFFVPGISLALYSYCTLVINSRYSPSA
jgi:hypothetical protein